jgi:hypothetical protein
MQAPNLICNSSIISDTKISYVMEPFESIDDEWFARGLQNEPGGLNLTLTNNALCGNQSLLVEHKVQAAAESSGGSADFG